MIDLRPLDPRIRQVWWIVGAVVVLFLLAVAGGIGALALDGGWRFVPMLVVLAVGAPLAVMVPSVRYRRWRFALREHDLWIRSGVLWMNTSVIPYARLQFVDTTQGPLDRTFGLAQLVVHTAAPGTSGRLPGLALADAEALREKLADIRATAHAAHDV
ncbi:MAG TPA: PH domain-containing protein [Euzebyales bacterium]|nr:PH domain-containing protein [Euzebyales bacterium]